MKIMLLFMQKKAVIKPIEEPFKSTLYTIRIAKYRKIIIEAFPEIFNGNFWEINIIKNSHNTLN